MEQTHRRSFFQWVVYAVIGCVIVITLLTAGYFYFKYKNAQKLLASNPGNQQVKAEEIIKKVGALMVLPQGETPTIATVSDQKKLQNTPFFAQAKNGDIVLIYSQAKKAILYDPKANKIVNVGPINLTNTAPTVSQPTPTPTGVAKAFPTHTSTPVTQ